MMEENGDQEFKIRQIKCLMSVKSKPGNATIFRTQNTYYRKQNTKHRIQNTEHRNKNTKHRTQNTEYGIKQTEQHRVYFRNVYWK